MVFQMKTYVLVFLIFFTKIAYANNWVIFDDDAGTNYYDSSAIEIHGFDRKVNVLNNASQPEEGVTSTLSTVQIDCRLGTIEVLSWQAFSKKMAAGQIVKSSQKASKVFFILPGTLEFELKKKVCS